MYQDLGWAVQEQLQTLLENEYEPLSLNENAVAMIKKFGEDIQSFDREVANEILFVVEDYERQCEKENEEV